MMNNINQKKATDYPLIYLQNFVYPTLNQAITQLVEYVLTTNEINEHQERLKQQRILNKAEQKRHNKERLREELGNSLINNQQFLGSEYESSEDDEDSSFQLDFNADEKGAIQGGEEALSEEESQTIQELANNTQEQKQSPDINTQEKEDIVEKNLIPIEEEPSLEKSVIDQRASLKFNPVQYLANALKELNQQKKVEAK